MKTLKWLALGLSLIACGCAGSSQAIREVYQPVNPAIHADAETVQVTPAPIPLDNTVITQTDDHEVLMVTYKD